MYITIINVMKQYYVSLHYYIEILPVGKEPLFAINNDGTHINTTYISYNNIIIIR